MFRSNDKEYDALVAENRFITDIQLEIERALDHLEMSQKELAQLANISEARVSQILSENGKNLQARTIARLAHVMGLRPRLELSDADNRSSVRLEEKIDFQSWTRICMPPIRLSLTEQLAEPEIANENEVDLAVAA